MVRIDFIAALQNENISDPKTSLLLRETIMESAAKFLLLNSLDGKNELRKEKISLWSCLSDSNNIITKLGTLNLASNAMVLAEQLRSCEQHSIKISFDNFQNLISCSLDTLFADAETFLPSHSINLMQEQTFSNTEEQTWLVFFFPLPESDLFSFTRIDQKLEEILQDSMEILMEKNIPTTVRSLRISIVPIFYPVSFDSVSANKKFFYSNMQSDLIKISPSLYPWSSITTSLVQTKSPQQNFTLLLDLDAVFSSHAQFWVESAVSSVRSLSGFSIEMAPPETAREQTCHFLVENFEENNGGINIMKESSGATGEGYLLQNSFLSPHYAPSITNNTLFPPHLSPTSSTSSPLPTNTPNYTSTSLHVVPKNPEMLNHAVRSWKHCLSSAAPCCCFCDNMFMLSLTVLVDYFCSNEMYYKSIAMSSEDKNPLYPVEFLMLQKFDEAIWYQISKPVCERSRIFAALRKRYGKSSKNSRKLDFEDATLSPLSPSALSPPPLPIAEPSDLYEAISQFEMIPLYLSFMSKGLSLAKRDHLSGEGESVVFAPPCTLSLASPAEEVSRLLLHSKTALGLTDRKARLCMQSLGEGKEGINHITAEVPKFLMFSANSWNFSSQEDLKVLTRHQKTNITNPYTLSHLSSVDSMQRSQLLAPFFHTFDGYVLETGNSSSTPANEFERSQIYANTIHSSSLVLAVFDRTVAPFGRSHRMGELNNTHYHSLDVRTCELYRGFTPVRIRAENLLHALSRLTLATTSRLYDYSPSLAPLQLFGAHQEFNYQNLKFPGEEKGDRGEKVEKDERGEKREEKKKEEKENSDINEVARNKISTKLEVLIDSFRIPKMNNPNMVSCIAQLDYELGPRSALLLQALDYDVPEGECGDSEWDVVIRTFAATKDSTVSFVYPENLWGTSQEGDGIKLPHSVSLGVSTLLPAYADPYKRLRAKRDHLYRLAANRKTKKEDICISPAYKNMAWNIRPHLINDLPDSDINNVIQSLMNVFGDGSITPPYLSPETAPSVVSQSLQHLSAVLNKSSFTEVIKFLIVSLNANASLLSFLSSFFAVSLPPPSILRSWESGNAYAANRRKDGSQRSFALGADYFPKEPSNLFMKYKQQDKHFQFKKTFDDSALDQIRKSANNKTCEQLRLLFNPSNTSAKNSQETGSHISKKIQSRLIAVSKAVGRS